MPEDQHSPSRPKTDLGWIHLLRAFFFCGDAARLGPHASVVLLAIKSHTDFQTGDACPSASRLSDLTGVSRREVIRSLGRLAEAGFLAKEADGRRMRYRVRERLAASGSVVTWDYASARQGQLLEQIKAALAAKTLPAPDTNGVIHIDHLEINVAVQVVQPGGIGIQVAGPGGHDTVHTAKALRYLDAADFSTRRRWHKRALELGAPQAAPCAREAVPVWGPFVAEEIAHDHRL